MANAQTKLNKKGLAHMAALAAVCRQLWTKACEFDGIESSASFVVFSEGNPFVPFREKAVTELMRAKQEYAAGGYVGLTIEGGKAVL